MRTLRSVLVRLTNLFRKETDDRDIVDELDAHLDHHIEDNIRHGMTPSEARRRAVLALGGLGQTIECYRAQRGLPALETTLQDLRYALRTMRRNPAFAAAAIVTLGLGIGANATIYSFGEALAFRPLDVPHADNLVRVFSATKSTPYSGMSYPDYRDLREHANSLSGLVAFGSYALPITNGQNEPSAVVGALAVSDNYFSALEVEPALGRGFSADEGRTGGPSSVAVISYRFWQRALASDPHVLGRTLTFAREPFTIVGVAPSYFSGSVPFYYPDIYIPIAAIRNVVSSYPKDVTVDRALREFTILGRLAPRTTTSGVNAELAELSRTLARDYPDTNRDRAATVQRELDARNSVDHNRQPAQLLLGLAALALLIACLNLANLLLSRAAGRRKEIAVRLAIGASRGRLVRQLLTESALLSVLGGSCGLLIAWQGVRYLSAVGRSILSNSDIQLILDLRLDRRVLVFTAVASIVSVVVFGLAPAMQTVSVNLTTALKGLATVFGGRLRSRRTSLKSVFVVAQVAFSVVVLTAAGLAIQGFLSIRQLDPGFHPDHVLLLTFDPSLVRYSQGRMHDFYEQLTRATATLSGVDAVGLAQTIPLSGLGSGGRTSLAVDGFTLPDGQETVSIRSNVVDPGYWNAMRSRVVRGRTFDARDTATSARVIVINETMARTYWPDHDAIGQSVHLDTRRGERAEVIGVVQDGKYNDITEPSQSALFIPFAQKTNPWMMATMVVRGAGDVTRLIPAIRQEAARLDASVPVFNIRSLESVYESRAMLPQRLIAEMTTAMGLLGLALAVIGLYGVLAYLTALRTREFGIRMALGAERVRLLWLVLREALIMAAAGLLVGIGLAIVLAPVFVAAFEFPPTNFAVLGLVVAFLAVTSSLAAWIPARRATLVNPVIALRDE